MTSPNPACGRGRLRNRARHRTIVDSQLLQDARLNLAAKGLYAMLLSLPDDWTFRKPDLIKRAGVGRAAFNSAMQALKELGLVASRQRNVPGQAPEWIVEVTDQIGDFTYEPRSYQHKLALQPKAENQPSASGGPESENQPSEGGPKSDFPESENRPPVNQKKIKNITPPIVPPTVGDGTAADAAGGLVDSGLGLEGGPPIPEPPPDVPPGAPPASPSTARPSTARPSAAEELRAAVQAKHPDAAGWACPDFLDAWLGDGLPPEGIAAAILASPTLERARSWKYFDRQVRSKAQPLAAAAKAIQTATTARDPKLQGLLEAARAQGHDGLASDLKAAKLEAGLLVFEGRARQFWRSRVADQAPLVRRLAQDCGLDLAMEVVA